MADLIYQSSPKVTIATNTFIDVPVILQFDDTPLISVVREAQVGFTSEYAVYHSDGTYLAKVKGARVYPTEDGKKAGVTVRELPGHWVCSVDGRTAFEIRQGRGDAFRTDAELYTPTGHFLKIADDPRPALFSASGEALRVGGVTMIGNVFQGCRIGIWLRSDGSLAIGA